VWLTRFALTRPVVTLMVFIALAVFGIIAYFQIGRAQDPPGVAFPVVVVSAGYSGASPQDMEKLVVKPIEDQIEGIDNLDQVTATAQEGVAVVVVQFKIGTNLDLAAIDVQRRVDTARVFMPTDLDPPLVEKNGSIDSMLDYAVSSSTLTPTALADVVTNRLVPVLKQIPMVQTVDVSGTRSREFHVEPNPAALASLGATLGDVFGAVASNNANLPGGLMQQPTQEANVSIHADVQQAADLAAIPLPIPGANGKVLRIADVASTDDGFADQRTISRFNGQPRVHVSLYRNITADEVTATNIARQQIKDIQKQFPQLTLFETDAPADFTVAELNGVWVSLLEGIILTAIVMMLFLHAWRNAIAVMIAIPTSILSTFVVMKFFGFTFDFMSLMGLSLIIGILVDDSIVVLENITRHRDLGESPMDAAVNGRTEIGSAAIAITMVDVVVFLPIAFLPGIVGMYLKEFALVVVVATLFSLLVSFTLTPLLAAKWSIVRRSEAAPRWLAMLDKPVFNIALVVAGLALALFPWPYGSLLGIVPWQYFKVFGIIAIALVLLNLFVARYDRILGYYRTVALPFALRHGYLTLFVCGVLLMNALLLVGGGLISAAFDVIVLVGLLCGLVLGVPFRRSFKDGKLNPIDYMGGTETGVVSIVGRHFAALFGARPNKAKRFAGQRNMFRFLARSAAGMYSNKWITMAAFALPIALGLAAPVLGGIAADFVPSGQTGEIQMTLTYPSGTPIATTSKRVDALGNAILKIDGIQSVSSTVGRKPTGHGQSVGGNYARLNATTFAYRRGDTDAIIDEIRKLENLAPGGDFQVSGAGGGGSGASIFYALTGPDAQLNAAADKVVAFLRSQPGSVNVQSSAETGAPRLNMQVDAAKAAILGVSPGDAASAARIAIDGAVATKVRTQDGLVDVRVRFPESARNTVESLKNVRVRASDGTLVPLASIATFTWGVAPTKIERMDRQRVVNVTGGLLPNYALGDVTRPLEKKLGEPGFLPAGVHLQAQGDTQYMMETFGNMGIALLMSFMLMYMLMVILYGNFVEPLIVMFSVPMAIIGALNALAIMHKFPGGGGQSLNIISGIGIIMLFGLVSKNGILLVDYSNLLVRRGMRVSEGVLQAAATRFRPILMTTFAMAFGMLPLALGFAEGSEWRQAMGTVIIGGLMSSLILTLFLVPMIYNTWIGFSERVKDHQAVREEMEPVGTPISAPA
jgi:multidrug efflux pump subunit AcrB